MAAADDTPLSSELIDSDDDAMSVSLGPVPNDNDLELEYQPPENFVLDSLANTGKFDVDSLAGEGKELWLFRVPTEVPLSALNGLMMQIPGSQKSSKKSSSAPLGRITVTERSNSEQYGVFDVTQPGSAAGEAGEMTDLKCILPSRKAGAYVLSQKQCARFFSVTPVGDHPPTKEELEDAGEKVAAMPNERLVHPEGMGLQSLPFGFATEGKALELSLERYADRRNPTASGVAPASASQAGRSKKSKKEVTSAETPQAGKKVAEVVIPVSPSAKSASKKRKTAEKDVAAEPTTPSVSVKKRKKATKAE
ncbi:hypothetical protein HDU87_003634 [Geranomyces variabilis]|uniref:Uncharacterized protein n=1 Tax=Geranomyces variabilis TaxID=109894 RepID=A0AAD5TPN0_9FUNG|nr:hypothetical protein HDU87_003634 [Geranomyces variabilis]